MEPEDHWVGLHASTLVVGLQGSGKTTTAAKLAHRLSRDGRSSMLAACDLQRPAAVEQLRTLADRIGVPIHAGEPGGDPVATAREALARARDERRSVLVVDTAGRLQIDEPLMDELRRMKAELDPREVLFVADAMTGQEAVRIAQGFDDGTYRPPEGRPQVPLLFSLRVRKPAA
jgi:signal recognition particle subunit SRP54